MSNSFDEHVKIGRKVFFVCPNLTIFPETFCEDFLVAGFECYFLLKDNVIALEDKIEILVRSFKDIVLIFNIDAVDPKKGVSWLHFIKDLNKEYGNSLMTGIMYTKRPTNMDNEQMQFLYENEARVNCGAYTLEYNKNKNFETILQALSDIDARGRRKHVRVLCSANCKIRLNFGGTEYFSSMADLSLTHFSFVADPNAFSAKINDKFSDAEFNIRGAHFSHDATMILTRPASADCELFVLAFTKKNGQHGLDENIHTMILPKLYGMLNENFINLFNKFCDEKLKK